MRMRSSNSMLVRHFVGDSTFLKKEPTVEGQCTPRSIKVYCDASFTHTIDSENVAIALTTVLEFPSRKATSAYSFAPALRRGQIPWRPSTCCISCVSPTITPKSKTKQYLSLWRCDGRPFLHLFDYYAWRGSQANWAVWCLARRPTSCVRVLSTDFEDGYVFDTAGVGESDDGDDPINPDDTPYMHRDIEAWRTRFATFLPWPLTTTFPFGQYSVSPPLGWNHVLQLSCYTLALAHSLHALPILHLAPIGGLLHLLWSLGCTLGTLLPDVGDQNRMVWSLLWVYCTPLTWSIAGPWC